MASKAKKSPNKTAARSTSPVGPLTFARRTITLPQTMDAQVSALAGRGKFSAFAQRALIHEMQRETIAQWLDERESSRGGKSPSAEALEFAERAWSRRKERA